MGKNNRLNNLHKTLRADQKEIRRLDEEVESLQNQRRDARERVRKSEARIKILNNDKPIVTQHAVYRYLQRSVGMNISEIHEQMLTPTALDLMDKMAWADGKYPTGDGTQLVLKDGAIVTVNA